MVDPLINENLPRRRAGIGKRRRVLAAIRPPGRSKTSIDLS
jgi:hypothetical protein